MKIFWTGNQEQDLKIDTYEEDLEYENSELEKWQVALDIIEDEDEFIIVSPIAWVDLDDIDISIKDWVLLISWNRKKPIELYLNGSVLRVSELFWGKFSRTIILPENLDLDNIKAILEKNILVIRIQKLKFKGQQINIEKIDY